MDDESDIEMDVSGGKQDSESDESLKMHKEDAETESTSNAVESEEQVQCFVSVEEFGSAVKHLRRVPISELDLESDLEQGYVGGHVIAQCFGDLSQQGHLELVVSDRSQAKNVTCYISGPLSEMLPALNHGYLLFLSRVEVKSMHSEFSQDHSECVVAEGTRPRVWVVHKDVKRKHIVKWGQKYQKMKSKQANKAKAGKGITTGHQATTNNVDKAVDRGEDRYGLCVCACGCVGVGGGEGGHMCVRVCAITRSMYMVCQLNTTPILYQCTVTVGVHQLECQV